MSHQASKALGAITESSRFRSAAGTFTVSQAATDLAEAYPVATDG
ncbi:hypothetical protein [Streptomyces tendae]